MPPLCCFADAKPSAVFAVAPDNALKKNPEVLTQMHGHDLLKPRAVPDACQPKDTTAGKGSDLAGQVLAVHNQILQENTAWRKGRGHQMVGFRQHVGWDTGDGTPSFNMDLQCDAQRQLLLLCAHQSRQLGSMQVLDATGGMVEVKGMKTSSKHTGQLRTLPTACQGPHAACMRAHASWLPLSATATPSFP
jgi:hypothetical protein